MSDESRLNSGETRARRAFGLYLLIALVATAAVAASQGVVETFKITSRSMQPTLEVGERVVGYSISVFHARVAVGDLVTFAPPSEAEGSIPLVKRVVALPGDLVWVSNGVLFVDGQARREPYLAEAAIRYTMAPYLVPPQGVFLLGDNRNASDDSSSFGPIRLAALSHKILLRYDPWARRCSFGPDWPGLKRCATQPTSDP